MTKETAKRPTAFMPSSLRRGFDQACIEIKREYEVLPPEELVASYRRRVEQLLEQREEVWKRLGRPNKHNFRKKWNGRVKEHPRADLAALFIEIGQKISELNFTCNKINKETRKAVPLTFSQLFMGICRNTLPKEQFEQISEQAKALEQQGFVGTNEDWVNFVKELD